LIFLKKSIEEDAFHSYSMFTVFSQSPLIRASGRGTRHLWRRIRWKIYEEL